MKPDTRTRILFWFVPLGLVLFPLVILSYSAREAVSAEGDQKMFEAWSMFLVLPFMAALPALLIALVCLLFPRIRRTATITIIWCLVYIGSFLGSARLSGVIRMHGFHQLAERSKPLVAAVKAYEQKHGHPPASLDLLVPDFIPAIPHTGMGAYPNYQYSCPTNAASYHGNPWVIVVETPLGFINWDQFMYFPLQNYPRHGYGGWLERIDDWAYVHE